MSIVNNDPFAAQPPAGGTPTGTPTDTSTAAAPQPTAPATGGLVQSAMPAPSAAAPTPYHPYTRQVDPNQTVSGQVDSILAQDGPMMQRARALAREESNQRGLINSSLGVQSAQAAVMDRALPIAQQDASVRAQADSENLGARNSAAQFNTGEANRFKQQAADQKFSAAQSQMNREYTTSERLGTQDAQSKLVMQQATAMLTQLGVQYKLMSAQVPVTFSGKVASDMMDKAGVIMADAVLTPEAKRVAIDNLVQYANTTLSWAQKFYGVPMNYLQTPDNTVRPPVWFGDRPITSPAPALQPTATAPSTFMRPPANPAPAVSG